MGIRGMYVEYWWKVRRKETTRKTKIYVVNNIKMALGEIGYDGLY
jgi:hypothetical protein